MSAARNIHGEVMRRAKRGVEIEGESDERSEERPRAERERFGRPQAPATRRAERDGSSWSKHGRGEQSEISPKMLCKQERRRMFDSETPGSHPSVDCKAFGLCLQETCR